MAVQAIAANAQANGVEVMTELDDILDGPVQADVVTAGDVFYSKAMADRVLRFLKLAARAGTHVLVGDPGRAFFPEGVFTALSTVDVPVTEALESVRVKRTTVAELRPAVTS